MNKSKRPAKTGRNQAGRFLKGISGNPKGRPHGSKNSATIALQSLLQGEGEAITRRAVELALNGDSTALRLCIERLIPRMKEQPVQLTLPTVTTATDITRAIGRVLEAVADGHITPSEGQALAGLLDAQRRALETIELEARIRALEERSE